jgi:ribonuclease HI
MSLYNKVVSENYKGYSNIFTDGLEQGMGVAAVAAAAVSHDKVLVKCLSNHASIFSAEAMTILLAQDIISQSAKQHFLILSHSVSCVNAIENRNLQNPLIVEIVERNHQQLNLDHRITFVWVPSHISRLIPWILTKTSSCFPTTFFEPAIWFAYKFLTAVGS